MLRRLDVTDPRLDVLDPARLAPLYPEWDRFLTLREEWDPRGTFLNPHLRDLFGI